MKFRVPKGGVDEVTNRITRLELIADISPEEIFLTKMQESLRDGTWGKFTLEFKDGHQMIARFDDQKEENDD